MMGASKSPGVPAELEALVALARGEIRAGRLVEAAAACERILAIRPDIAEAHHDLGIIFAQQGQSDQATARLEQAIALRPDYAPAYNNLGNVLLGQGKLDEAAARFAQALAVRPDYAQAHNNLGNVLLTQDKLDEAAPRFAQALALRPDLAEAHVNLGIVLMRQDKLDEAAARYEQALALRPDYAEAHFNLGSVLMQQAKHEQAQARFEQALALKPDYADALKNLGTTLWYQLNVTEARQAFERLRAIEPDSTEAHLGVASCLLVDGDYERGWPVYEGRIPIAERGPQFGLPRWTGQPLAGRGLLLLAEQGFGDSLQFVRYAKAVKERGARVVLACRAVLGPLLASQPDLDEIYILGSGKKLPPLDYYLPLLSAPAAFHTTATTIPSEVPYLAADPELTERWRRELGEIDGFKIGIFWQGSRTNRSDRWRSVPLAHFAPLANLPGVRLIGLQKGFGAEQIALVDFPVLDLSARLDESTGPFMDTAAVIRNLDLVVSVDSAIGHLAGALAGPVWLALQFASEWRWLRGRDDSPWYPTMRLFRQTTFGEWPDVFERMADAVQRHGSKTA